jgi:Glycosyl transferase family 2
MFQFVSWSFSAGTVASLAWQTPFLSPHTAARRQLKSIVPRCNLSTLVFWRCNLGHLSLRQTALKSPSFRGLFSKLLLPIVLHSRLITLSFTPPATSLAATEPSPKGGAKPQNTVDVILPALNEAEALQRVLAAIPAGIRAIVVDNGSTDNTAAAAKAHGATLVFKAVPGFGSACYRGLLAATADIV